MNVYSFIFVVKLVDTVRIELTKPIILSNRGIPIPVTYPKFPLSMVDVARIELAKPIILSNRGIPIPFIHPLFFKNE
jgi:hypothetical protein